jgi:hypothetical protein
VALETDAFQETPVFHAPKGYLLARLRTKRQRLQVLRRYAPLKIEPSAINPDGHLVDAASGNPMAQLGMLFREIMRRQADLPWVLTQMIANVLCQRNELANSHSGNDT